jgi:hypothetical protein
MVVERHGMKCGQGVGLVDAGLHLTTAGRIGDLQPSRPSGGLGDY